MNNTTNKPIKTTIKSDNRLSMPILSVRRLTSNLIERSGKKESIKSNLVNTMLGSSTIMPLIFAYAFSIADFIISLCQKNIADTV